MAQLRLSSDASREALNWALSAAEQGWPVFPLQRDGKAPLPGSRGFYDATTDIADVSRLFTVPVPVSVGVRCSGQAGFAVDIDVKQASGFESLAQLRRDAVAALELPANAAQLNLLTTMTPSSGRHWIFATPEDFVVPTMRGWLPGVDLRGPNGYRVGWGPGYTSAAPGTPPEAPQWLLDRLPRQQSRATGSGITCDALSPGEESCSAVYRALDRWYDAGQHQEHHDTARLITYLLLLRSEGHRLTAADLRDARTVYTRGRADKTLSDNTPREDGGQDWDRMLGSAMSKAEPVTNHRDPCNPLSKGA